MHNVTGAFTARQLRFECEVRTPIQLQAHKGSALRRLLFHALRGDEAQSNGWGLYTDVGLSERGALPVVDVHGAKVVTQDEDRAALEQAVKHLVEALSPEQIYLFGSQARGDADSGSNYDLLVVVAHSDEPSYRRAQAAYHALWGVRLPVDVIVFTRAEFDYQAPALASLPATVVREGRLLYAA